MKLSTIPARPVAAALAVGGLVAATAALTPFALAEDSGSSAATQSAVVGAAPKVVKSDRGQYLVYLDAVPTVAYAGDVDGLSATKAPAGRRFDSTTAAVAAYTAHLDAERARVLDAADVSASKVFYTYNHSVAGFAAELSYDEAVRLAQTPGVLSVGPDLMHEADTSHTPTFLGLDDPDTGLWTQLGGPDTLGGAGEDIVVGVIDSGFSPDAGSFAPLDPAPVDLIPEGWNGTCEPGDPDDVGGGPYAGGEGDDPAAIECQEVDAEHSIVNSKVIGARAYGAGSGQLDAEFLSARDYNGHGSNVGSIAVGNNGVPVTVAGNPLGNISGMAPRARLAVYKALWQTEAGTASGSGSDLVAAVDQAVADGVDVINYSISGDANSALSDVGLSFLFAADAGIFIATSAGNDGPDPSTVAKNQPWLTTVAASTQDRRFEVTVTLGNGDTYTGAGIGAAVPETDAVYAGAIPLDGFEDEAAYCQPGSLDPELADGKIVVCDRGLGIARTAKSDAVAQAGGVGMVLANDEPNAGSLVTERHAVPTAHVSYQDGIAIKDYVGDNPDPDATIALSASDEVVGDEVTAPEMASFSSRGPGGVANGDLLKPDITAPGVDILGAVAPTAANAGETYGLVSGTSQASPHIAGIGALLQDLHPDWSPAAIRSAIVTSGYHNNNQGNPIQALDPATGELVPATPFEYGGGHVQPQDAAGTPAVYDSGFDQWVQFLCGTGELDPQGTTCQDLGSIDPSDLNMPSIAIGDLAGVQTVTRSLTNVTDEPLVLAGEVEVDGVTATLSTPTLEIPAGGSADFTIDFTTDTAPVDTYTFGSLTWTEQAGAGRTIVSPIAIQPVAIGDAAGLLVGEGSTGEVTDTVIVGTDAEVAIDLGGLEPGVLTSAVLAEPTGNFPTTDPLSCLDDPACAVHAFDSTYAVPEGARIAHFALYEEDYVAGTDIDMFVYLEDEAGDLELVAQSASGIAGESVLINEPAAGTYHVFVELFALAPDETEVTSNLYSWAVTDADVDDFTVDPATFTAAVGDEQDVTFSWNGLAGPAEGSTEPARYLGVADYTTGGEPAAQTVVRVDVTEGPTTPPPTTEPPTTPPPTTVPPTSPPSTPVPSTTLPHTGGDDVGLFAGLGLAAILIGGAFVALAARRLREDPTTT